MCVCVCVVSLNPILNKDSNNSANCLPCGAFLKVQCVILWSIDRNAVIMSSAVYKDITQRGVMFLLP